MENLNNINDLQIKIIEGMKQVRLDLIAYKTKMNSPIVILQEGKIVHISAEEYAKLPVLHTPNLTGLQDLQGL